MAALRTPDQFSFAPSCSEDVDAPSRISRSSSNDRQPLTLRLRLALVLPFQEVLEQVAQELQRDVLEREGRSVEQLEDVLLLADTMQGGDLGMTEGRVGAVDELLEVLPRDFRGRDEQRVEVERELGEGKVCPVVLPVLGKGRKVRGNVETAIGRESCEDRLREEEGRRRR